MRVEECSTNNHTDNGQPDNNPPPSLNQTTRPTTQEGYLVPTTTTTNTPTTTTTTTTSPSTTTTTTSCSTTTTTTSASPIPSTAMGVIARVNLGSSRGPPLPHNPPQGTSYTLPPAPGVHIVPAGTNDPTTTTADPRETSRDPLVGHRAENSRQGRAPVHQGRAPVPEGRASVPQGRAPVPGVTTTLAHREGERLAALTRRLVKGQPVKRKLWDVDHQRVKEELEEELERLLEEEECRFRSRWKVVEGCSTGPAFYCTQVITAEGTEELATPPVSGPGDIKVTHALAKRRRTQPPFPASASLVLSKGSQLPLVVSQDSGLPQVSSNLLSQRESQQQTYTPPAEAVVTECHSAKSENGSNSVSPTKPASISTSESA
ncbi:uncharacterized protein, partial [Procambarus clarkii]|uniref:uncharacterized protein n=1 Tax=Procambarus clarkii TaxID=6728 RepID=UPI0037432747